MNRQLGPRPVSALFQDLLTHLSALLRSEIRLATAELKANARAAARRGFRATLLLSIAALGIFPLLAAAVIGLGHLLDESYGWSSLLVALAFLLGAGVLGLRALREIPEELELDLTQENVREDVALISPQRKAS